jgi:hypothetical protein
MLLYPCTKQFNTFCGPISYYRREEGQAGRNMQVMIFGHEVGERSTDGPAIDVEKGRLLENLGLGRRRVLSPVERSVGLVLVVGQSHAYLCDTY